MGLVHQTVEQMVVKGQRRGILLLDGSQHGRLLHPVRADAIPVGPKGKKRRSFRSRQRRRATLILKQNSKRDCLIPTRGLADSLGLPKSSRVRIDGGEGEIRHATGGLHFARNMTPLACAGWLGGRRALPREAGIPFPSLAVSTGRGLQLIWLTSWGAHSRA